MTVTPWTMKFSLVTACILSGALTTVILKSLLETTVSHPDGSMTTFSCPYFATFLNFFAMTVLVFLQTLFQNVWLWWSCMSQPQAHHKPHRLSGGDTVRYIFGRYNIGISTIHFAATLCTSTALLFVPATVQAAVRQGNIPLVVALRAYVLEKHSTRHQFIGAAVVTLGLVLMGVASHAGNDHVHGAMHTGFGIGLLGLSAVLLAGRYVTEELLMQHDKIPPMVVVGAQGLLGSIFSAFSLVFAHHMGYEGLWTTLGMLQASRQVQLLVVDFLAMTIVYGLAMAYTTKVFDSTCKAMIRGTKPISVWALQLLCFSIGSKYSRGEPWVYPGSWFVFIAASIVSGGLCFYFYKPCGTINKENQEDKLEYGTLNTARDKFG